MISIYFVNAFNLTFHIFLLSTFLFHFMRWSSFYTVLFLAHSYLVSSYGLHHFLLCLVVLLILLQIKPSFWEAASRFKHKAKERAKLKVPRHSNVSRRLLPVSQADIFDPTIRLSPPVIWSRRLACFSIYKAYLYLFCLVYSLRSVLNWRSITT